MADDSARRADLRDKVARLAELAARRGVDTIVLRDPAALTWLLGCRVNVPQTLDAACLDVVVHLTDGPRLQIVTNAIEAPRLRDTELAWLDGDGVDAPGTSWSVVPWWEARDAALPTTSGASVGTDRPLDGARDLSADLRALRRTLTPHQAVQLRDVATDTAAAASEAALGLEPTTSEYAAAGLLASALLRRGLDPVVLLVGGVDRLDAHRHPLPTAAALGRRGMLVACGRRHGLVASVTRIVSFAPLTTAEQDGYRRLLAVEQAFLDATRPGARLGDVVATGTAAYSAHDFDPHEWHRHHQGGPTGWQPREFPADPGSDVVLDAGQVVAWNPSGGGWKVEDTTLVTPSGCEPLVHDPTWPTLAVAGRLRPDVLVR